VGGNASGGDRCGGFGAGDARRGLPAGSVKIGGVG
jgi:hypothetical protein